MKCDINNFISWHSTDRNLTYWPQSHTSYPRIKGRGLCSGPSNPPSLPHLSLSQGYRSWQPNWRPSIPPWTSVFRILAEEPVFSFRREEIFICRNPSPWWHLQNFGLSLPFIIELCPIPNYRPPPTLLTRWFILFFFGQHQWGKFGSKNKMDLILCCG